MTHELKILPEYYGAVLSGEKTFEIRLNDRNYQVGDILILKEWDPYEGYTLRQLKKMISYILYDFEDVLHDKYCIMSLKDVPNEVKL